MSELCDFWMVDALLNAGNLGVGESFGAQGSFSLSIDEKKTEKFLFLLLLVLLAVVPWCDCEMMIATQRSGAKYVCFTVEEHGTQVGV